MVDAVGAGVTRWRKGMRVAAAGVMPLDVCGEDDSDYSGPQGMMGIKRPGGFAELVAVPACAVVALPDGLDFHHAAVVMRHVPTAWNLLFNVAELKAGETVLIMGAGGNLGSIGIQIAKNVIGAKVIATAGSDDRVQTGLALGADCGINYNQQDLAAEVMAFTGGKGVDVLYDNVANPKVLPQAFRTIGFDGRLVTAGAHAGPNVTDRLLAPLPQAHHHQGPARLSPARRGEMLRRRGGGQGSGADRTDSAAVARRRGAPAGRIRRGDRQARARPDAGVKLVATSSPLCRDAACAGQFRPLPVTLACGGAARNGTGFPAEALPHCAGPGGMPIFPPLPSSPMTPRLRLQGRAKRRGDLAMVAPLMPKATAVWLVENTALSFDQVADFCKLHPLEVKAIADGDAAQGIKGLDPVLTGQLSREEIEKAVADPNRRLKLLDPKVRLPEAKKKKGPRYTPVSRRQDRPNAILWLVRNHPELKDSQVMRLVGTTKSTIQAIRERTHWNASNLQPMDPVTLGLCSQIDLDLEVHRAAKEKPVDVESQGATLLPASETTIRREPEPEEKKPADELNVDAVFAKLKQIGGKNE